MYNFKLLALTFSFILANNLFSQEVSDKQILKEMKAKEIIWGEFYEEDIALVKMKETKKWGMYRVDHYMYERKLDYEEIIPPLFDSIGWFEEKPFAIVKLKKKYGLLLNPYEIYDAAQKVKFEYDAIKVIEKDYEYTALAKVNSKWGIIDWFDGTFLVDPMYDTPADVPLLDLDDWTLDIYKAAKQKLAADIVEFDPNNGDGAFRARSRETQKWGLFQSYDTDTIYELIPMAYDSVEFIPINGYYTAVYQNGKVGIYLSKWSYKSEARQTIPCEYEGYKRYELYGNTLLALKKNEKWAWVDWITGDAQTEFKYNSTDELPSPTPPSEY